MGVFHGHRRAFRYGGHRRALVAQVIPCRPRKNVPSRRGYENVLEEAGFLHALVLCGFSLPFRLRRSVSCRVVRNRFRILSRFFVRRRA